MRKIVLRLLLALIEAWPQLLLAALTCIIAWFWVRIDPTQQYGFGWGMVHGLFWFPNALFSLFDDRAVWAVVNSGWRYWAGFFGAQLLYWLVNMLIRIAIELFIEEQARRRESSRRIIESMRRW